MKKLLKIHGNCKNYKFNKNLIGNGICMNCYASEGLSPADNGCDFFNSK